MEENGEWKKVSKKYKSDKLKPIKHYWNGFDDNGKEKWYFELSNGVVISNKDFNYDFWAKKYYPKLKSFPIHK